MPDVDAALPPGPYHYLTTARDGEPEGAGHVYACDANGRKIASMWGPAAAKMRRGVTYDQLAEKLAAIGVQDTAVNIRNKVARGKFTAVFLVQCLEAMGCRSLRLADGDN